MAAFAKSPLGSQWPHSLVGRDIGGSQLISKHVLPTAPSPTTTHLRDCIAICSKGNVFRSVAPSCTHRRRSRLYCLPRCTKKATPCPSRSPTRAHAGRARAAAYMAHGSGAQVPKANAMTQSTPSLPSEQDCEIIKDTRQAVSLQVAADLGRGVPPLLRTEPLRTSSVIGGPEWRDPPVCSLETDGTLHVLPPCGTYEEPKKHGTR